MGENNGNHNMISACGLLTNGCTSAAAMAMAAAANGSLSPTSFLVQQQQQQNSSNSSTTSSASSSTAQSQQQFSADYLSQLLKDKKQLTAFPNMFMHLERLVDEEIAKVRSALFHLESSNKEALILPDASGNVITVQEKVYVPVKEFPDYNFVGRILGPRGMTAKQLEQETNCKIMVRGKGSMRDKKKEEQNRGKPNWEHLTDELHVLIQCEDTENRAKVKIQRAIDEVKRLLVPAPEGEDDLKRKQLMELAIINGTYRPSNQKQIALQFFPENPRLLTPMSLTSPLRSPSLGAPIILSPNRLNNHNAAAQAAAANHAAAQQNALTNQMNNFQALSSLMPGAGADFQAAAAAAGLLYNFQVDPMASFQAAYPYSAAHAALTSPLLAGEYPGLDAQAGAILNQRRILAQAREHPYQRASLKTPTS